RAGDGILKVSLLAPRKLALCNGLGYFAVSVILQHADVKQRRHLVCLQSASLIRRTTAVGVAPALVRSVVDRGNSSIEVTAASGRVVVNDVEPRPLPSDFTDVRPGQRAVVLNRRAHVARATAAAKGRFAACAARHSRGRSLKRALQGVVVLRIDKRARILVGRVRLPVSRASKGVADGSVVSYPEQPRPWRVAAIARRKHTAWNLHSVVRRVGVILGKVDVRGPSEGASGVGGLSPRSAAGQGQLVYLGADPGSG